jgi:hypothetical protein
MFFGNLGELRQKYVTGMEDQLGALGLGLNCVVWWNTLYIDAAGQQLESAGMRIPLEVRERLSPLQLDHINFNGRYPHDPRSGWRNAAAFDGYAFGLALQCVTELDPTDKKQCQTIGEAR